MNKLRHIKKILEDLQKQIRNLKAVSNEELSRSMPRTSSEPTPSTSRGTAASTSERPSTSSMMEDTDDDDLDANSRGQSKAKLQVAKYNKLKFAIKRLSSDQPRRPPQPDQSLHRTSNRLSRVHSQLVSQMRATYRAMERKNQFQRSSSPLSSSASPLTTSWQKIVAEETSLTRPLPLHERNKDANPSDTSSASGVRPEDTKKELRALSQRLEKLLREKREKVNDNSSKASSSTLPSTSSSAAADLDASTSAASSQVNSSAIEIDDTIPRLDPLPVDPR